MDDAGSQPPGGPQEPAAIARALHEVGEAILHVTTRKLLRDEPWGEPLVSTVLRAVPQAVLIDNAGLKTLKTPKQASRAPAAIWSLAG